MKNKIKLSQLTIALFTSSLTIVLLAATMLLSSCSNDDDSTGVAYSELPSNLTGTYTGILSYTNNDGSVVIGNEEGTATISSAGSKNYTISFSDGVSSITNLKFIADSGEGFKSVSQDGSTAGVDINTSSMELNLNNGGNSWGFTGIK